MVATALLPQTLPLVAVTGTGTLDTEVGWEEGVPFWPWMGLVRGEGEELDCAVGVVRSLLPGRGGHRDAGLAVPLVLPKPFWPFRMVSLKPKTTFMRLVS